jgi:hypothetical protein
MHQYKSKNESYRCRAALAGAVSSGTSGTTYREMNRWREALGADAKQPQKNELITNERTFVMPGGSETGKNTDHPIPNSKL